MSGKSNGSFDPFGIVKLVRAAVDAESISAKTVEYNGWHWNIVPFWGEYVLRRRLDAEYVVRQIRKDYPDPQRKGVYTWRLGVLYYINPESLTVRTRYDDGGTPVYHKASSDISRLVVEYEQSERKKATRRAGKAVRGERRKITVKNPRYKAACNF